MPKYVIVVDITKVQNCNFKKGLASFDLLQISMYVDQEARGLHRFDLGPTSNVTTAHTSKSRRVGLINLSQLLSFSERTECN